MPAKTVPPPLRDQLMTEFRHFLCDRTSFVPFEHQAAWWATTDGYELRDETVDESDTVPSMQVRLPDGTVVHRRMTPRTHGRAKVVAELGAYKSGKSAGAGMWAAAFAAVPNALVYLVGNEYDMTAPEFEYLLEALCSERGLNQKYKSLQNRPKDGRLWLELDNGARFEARSWERSESLKGKEVDAYIYCEAYQLPGIECFTSVAQNLRVRQGYAVFPTTPDRPWVEIFHEHGHGHPDFPAWVCKCGIPATVNPYSFDQAAMDRDRNLLTREKFSIAYLGRLGDYVGRVYNYQRGTRLITRADHPRVWHNLSDEPVKHNFKVPPDWKLEIGADTGTYCAAVLIGVSPEGCAYVLDEVTNYRYVANTTELDSESSIVQWTQAVAAMAARWNTRPIAWVDTNSQFKQECGHHGLHLLANKRGREARTEGARQYFQHQQIYLAPWLSMIPYELEYSQWPDRTSAAGKYERIKVNDHALDCLEHVLSRHPRGTYRDEPRISHPAFSNVQWMGTPLRKRKNRAVADTHLGGL
jgi:hypothetical protein